MRKVYKIVSCSTDVHEDSYKDGEQLECVNQWSIKEICRSLLDMEFATLDDFSLLDMEFATLDDLLEQVGYNYLELPYEQKSENIKEYWFRFEDDSLKYVLRFDNDCLVDVNSHRIDKYDLASWKQGRKKLYNAHTSLYVKAEYVGSVALSEMEKDVEMLGIDVI